MLLRGNAIWGITCSCEDKREPISEVRGEASAPLVLLDACGAASGAAGGAVSGSLSAFLRDLAPPSRPASLLPEGSLLFF